MANPALGTCDTKALRIIGPSRSQVEQHAPSLPALILPPAHTILAQGIRSVSIT